MSVQIKQSGFNFAALSRQVRENISDVLNEGGDSFVTLRKELAPKDTGWMAERTRVEEPATPEHLRIVMICDSSNNPHRGGNNGAYDAFLEYGTVSQDAQPSATPAFESARRQVNNGLLGALRG